MSANWSNVARSNLGRAMQTLGAGVLHWLRLLQAVVNFAVGGALAVGCGLALREPDRSLPRLVGQWVQAAKLGAIAGLLPSASPEIRDMALAGLVAALLLVGCAFVSLCLWLKR
jgi:hypothetical protein